MPEKGEKKELSVQDALGELTGIELDDADKEEGWRKRYEGFLSDPKIIEILEKRELGRSRISKAEKDKGEKGRERMKREEKGEGEEEEEGVLEEQEGEPKEKDKGREEGGREETGEGEEVVEAPIGPEKPNDKGERKERIPEAELILVSKEKMREAEPRPKFKKGDKVIYIGDIAELKDKEFEVEGTHADLTRVYGQDDKPKQGLIRYYFLKSVPPSYEIFERDLKSAAEGPSAPAGPKPGEVRSEEKEREGETGEQERGSEKGEKEGKKGEEKKREEKVERREVERDKEYLKLERKYYKMREGDAVGAYEMLLKAAGADQPEESRQRAEKLLREIRRHARASKAYRAFWREYVESRKDRITAKVKLMTLKAAQLTDLANKGEYGEIVCVATEDIERKIKKEIEQKIKEEKPDIESRWRQELARPEYDYLKELKEGVLQKRIEQEIEEMRKELYKYYGLTYGRDV